MSVFYISRLPGKALRTLVDITMLAEGFYMLFQTQPGKLDIKISEPGIPFISLQADLLFKQAIMALLSIFA